MIPVGTIFASSLLLSSDIALFGLRLPLLTMLSIGIGGIILLSFVSTRIARTLIDSQ